MKKVTIVLLTLLCLFATACGKKEPNTVEYSPISENSVSANDFSSVETVPVTCTQTAIKYYPDTVHLLATVDGRIMDNSFYHINKESVAGYFGTGDIDYVDKLVVYSDPELTNVKCILRSTYKDVIPSDATAEFEQVYYTWSWTADNVPYVAYQHVGCNQVLLVEGAENAPVLFDYSDDISVTSNDYEVGSAKNVYTSAGKMLYYGDSDEIECSLVHAGDISAIVGEDATIESDHWYEIDDVLPRKLNDDYMLMTDSDNLNLANSLYDDLMETEQ